MQLILAIGLKNVVCYVTGAGVKHTKLSIEIDEHVKVDSTSYGSDRRPD